MSTHTPGPWTFDDDWGRTPMVVAPDGKTWIAAVQKQGGTGQRRNSRTPEQEANARLIAAAPDMLAALHDVVSSLKSLGLDGWSDAPHLMNVCSAAIAKAEERP